MVEKGELYGNRIMEKYKTFKKYEINALFIADKLSSGVYVIDKNGTVVDVNKTFEDIAGLKRDKL